MSRTATVIIPARLGSTRLAEKPLQTIANRPLIAHVCDRVASAGRIKRFVVATDHRRIADAVGEAGYEAVMTRADHPTGTDRIAEAASGLPGDVIINVQGDEPALPPSLLDRLAAVMLEHPEIPMGTVTVPLDHAHFADPNVVKVAVDARGFALYFSRAPIPHDWRSEGPSDLLRMHVGIYAFQRPVLNQFVALPQGNLEKREGLEQLRALENGIAIHVTHGETPFHGVETIEDLERARREAARTTFTTSDKE